MRSKRSDGASEEYYHHWVSVQGNIHTAILTFWLYTFLHFLNAGFTKSRHIFSVNNRCALCPFPRAIAPICHCLLT